MPEDAPAKPAAPERITAEEFELVRQQVIVFAQLVADLPLSAYVREVDRIDAIGPILDPTLYRNGQDQMHEIADLVRALVPFQKAGAAFKAKMVAALAKAEGRGG